MASKMRVPMPENIHSLDIYNHSIMDLVRILLGMTICFVGTLIRRRLHDPKPTITDVLPEFIDPNKEP